MCSRSRQCPRLVTATNLVFLNKIFRHNRGRQREELGLEEEQLKTIEQGRERSGTWRVQGLEHANNMPKGPSGGPSKGET
jgi:hypothetical protein